MLRCVIGVLLVGQLLAATAAAAPPSARAALRRAGFTEADEGRVLAGEFVSRDLGSDGNMDLTVALAFLVRVQPEELQLEMIHDALIDRENPQALSGGRIDGAGSLADFSGLSLGSDERKLYGNAAAGKSVNLSAAEIAALHGLEEPAAADVAIRKVLLARLESYRARGLGGIAPYDRGAGKKRDPAAALRRADTAARASFLFDAAFFDFLDAYPSAKLPKLDESFRWTRYEARGKPTLVLTHLFTADVAGTWAFVQRQFFVSRGYNSEQAIAQFLPVSEGTLVIYTNHTSTDQVAGFGGGGKRAIGERVMVSQLKGLFERLRKAASKQ